jgi:hypothetical protein
MCEGETNRARERFKRRGLGARNVVTDHVLIPHDTANQTGNAARLHLSEHSRLHLRPTRVARGCRHAFPQNPEPPGKLLVFDLSGSRLLCIDYLGFLRHAY